MGAEVHGVQERVTPKATQKPLHSRKPHMDKSRVAFSLSLKIKSGWFCQQIIVKNSYIRTEKFSEDMEEHPPKIQT